MSSLNKVQLIGNLGADPEMRHLPDSSQATSVTIATTYAWKDKATGAKNEKTEWHRVVFFRGLAEVVGQYLKKGMQIYIEGSLHTRKWTDKAGVERYTTEIFAQELKMLGKRPVNEVSGAPRAGVPQIEDDDDDDSVPF